MYFKELDHMHKAYIHNQDDIYRICIFQEAEEARIAAEKAEKLFDRVMIALIIFIGVCTLISGLGW